jgi:glucan-binding YG repeat protein
MQIETKYDIGQELEKLDTKERYIIKSGNIDVRDKELVENSNINCIEVIYNLYKDNKPSHTITEEEASSLYKVIDEEQKVAEQEIVQQETVEQTVIEQKTIEKESEVKVISIQEASKIIQKKEPIGLFIVESANGSFLAIDNSTQEALIGRFRKKENCISWLNGADKEDMPDEV